MVFQSNLLISFPDLTLHTKTNDDHRKLKKKASALRPLGLLFHEKLNSIHDLAKTSNIKNYTRMASKSDKLCNLDFQMESPQTMPHNNNDNFLYYYDHFKIPLFLRF